MKVICRKGEYLVGEIVEEYTNMLYRLAMVRTNNQADAEEVVQDTFLRFMYQIKKGMVLRPSQPDFQLI